MAHSYGGVLGIIAFVTMLVRGLLNGNTSFELLFTATLFLFAFAVVGFVLGSIAAQTVKESVKLQLNTELDALQKENTRA